MIRRLLVALSLSLVVLAASACRNETEPVSLGPSGPWTASDYQLLVEASHTQASAGEEVVLRPRLLDPEGLDVTESFDIASHITPALGVLDDGYFFYVLS